MVSVRKYQAHLKKAAQYTGLIDGDYGPLTRMASMQLQRHKARRQPVEDPPDDIVSALMLGEYHGDKRVEHPGWTWTSEANHCIEFDAKTRDPYEAKELDWTGGVLPRFPARSGWPGRFVAHCLAVGLNADVEELRPFQDWTTFGVETEPCYGAVCTFETEFGPYVGFLHRLQNGVCIVTGGVAEGSILRVRVPKADLTACRWPNGAAMEQEFFE